MFYRIGVLLFIIVSPILSEVSLKNVQLEDTKRYLDVKTNTILDIAKNNINNPNQVIFLLRQYLDLFVKSNPNKENHSLKSKYNTDISSPIFFWTQETNSNSRRLSLNEIQNKPIDGFFIKNSEQLFILHWELARAFMNLSLPVKNNAAFHIWQAMRYRSLKMTPNIFIDKDRYSILENNIEKDMVDKFQQNDTIAQDFYTKFEKEWNLKSVVFLREGAIIMKNIETALGEREKKNLKRSTQKNNFIQQDSYNNSNFSSYIDFLEMARRIDPTDPSIPFDISIQLETRYNPSSLLKIYEAILIAHENAPEDKKIHSDTIASIYFKLGNLHITFHNYIIAVTYYEQAITISPKIEWLFTYADILSNHIGKYSQAISIYQNYIIEHPIEKQLVPNKKNIFLAHWRSAECYLKLNNFENAIQQASLAKEIFLSIKEDILKLKTKNKELELLINKHLSKYKQEEVSDFLKYQKEKQELQESLSTLTTVLNSLPIRNVFFTLAEWLTIQQRLPLAISLYKEAEYEGIDPNEARTRYRKLEAILNNL